MPDDGDEIAGRYRLVRRIGSGGMGEVWLAYDSGLERQVALKRARSQEGMAVKRLRKEARNAARLHHPHITSVFDLVDSPGGCWIVMEYVASRSLAQTLAERGTMPPGEVASIGCQLAVALEVSHRAGVVHGDVTPDNVLMAEGDFAKLTDFGIARALWREDSRSWNGGVYGKPRYMAPEVARGQRLTAAADLFSLGATLHAALEGRSPYGTAEDPVAYLELARKGRVVHSGRAGALSAPLRALLSGRPESRPSAAEAARQLHELAGGACACVRPPGDGDRPPVPPGGQAWTWRRAAVAGTAALALVAATATVVTVAQPFRGRAGSSGAGAPADPGRNPGGPVGDVYSADPCSLLAPDSLARYGSVEIDPAYANFDRCDLLVDETGGAGGSAVVVDVSATFLLAGAQEPSALAEVERVGSVTVVSEPLEDEECQRLLRTSQGAWVRVVAKAAAGSPTRVCALADTAADRATGVLNRGGVARRSPVAAADRSSLIRSNACALLNAAALGQVAGLDSRHVEAGVGGWSCGWRGSGSSAEVDLRFDQGQPPTADDDGQPVRLGGRQAFVRAQGGETGGSCTVKVLYRTYRGAHGLISETLLLDVSGPGSAAQQRANATALATAVARSLPTAD
ncbi:putative serine/threonine protein kinase [Actinacidiphila reveromycinica]|uniref:non-specific serine/threonine protein kinase n=1 Tax=Actinacidiphila reveromycinica TaxID=659352 RepID=A0A7U3VSQ0_9ACTN|nr:serine/threonine-protein kinase [Streptomyces sp. SN-593]BBB01999.1 putative serine/threonine protein kinase [Streptomyces sp. SN-593]